MVVYGTLKLHAWFQVVNSQLFSINGNLGALRDVLKVSESSASCILTIKSLPPTVRTSPRPTRTTSLLCSSRIPVCVCTFSASSALGSKDNGNSIL